MERGPGPRRAVEADAAAHALDDALGDGEPEPGASEPAGRPVVGLLEFEKNARLRLRRDPDPGVAHGEADFLRPDAGLDDHRDAAGVGELDGVAGEIEQHLPQPCGVADHPLRQTLVEIGGDLEALGLHARGQQLDHFLHQGREPERARLEIELAGLDFGKIQDLVDQRQQRIARRLDRLHVGRLLGHQRGIEHQVGHAEDAVERRADLVRDHGEEPRFRPVGGLRLVAGFGERALGMGAVGDVAADALNLEALAAAHRDLAPGDPAQALRGLEPLVVHAGAVGQHGDVALLGNREPERGPEQRLAGSAGERAECVIGVGDQAVGTATDDDVALGLDETLGALLGVPELPIAVGKLFHVRLEPAVGGFQRMGAPGEQHQRAAKSRQHGGHERGRRGQRAGTRFEAKIAHSRKLHRPEDERRDACPRTSGERAGPSASGPHVHASVVALAGRPHGYPRRNPAQLRAVESAARGLPIPSWLAVLRAARFDTVEQGLIARTQGAARLADCE